MSHRSRIRLVRALRRQDHRPRPARLRLSRNIEPSQRELLRKLFFTLPHLVPQHVSVSIEPCLTTHRGKLLSGSPELGSPVHAASFIRERRIVLETDLFADARLLRLIFLHEHFHFVWPRLSNVMRAEYAALLETERDRRARGELGESSAVRKAIVRESGKFWRDYVCESFCDTAAWFYSGLTRHRTFTLGKHWRRRRSRWFQDRFERYWKLRCP